MGNMTISDESLEIGKKLEGFSPTWRDDGYGNQEILYGCSREDIFRISNVHNISEIDNMNYSQTTQYYRDTAFKKVLSHYHKIVDRLFIYTEQCELGMLILLAYNCDGGGETLEKSKFREFFNLWKKYEYTTQINVKPYKFMALMELLDFSHESGKLNAGLCKRNVILAKIWNGEKNVLEEF